MNRWIWCKAIFPSLSHRDSYMVDLCGSQLFSMKQVGSYDGGCLQTIICENRSQFTRGSKNWHQIPHKLARSTFTILEAVALPRLSLECVSLMPWLIYSPPSDTDYSSFMLDFTCPSLSPAQVSPLHLMSLNLTYNDQQDHWGEMLLFS